MEEICFCIPARFESSRLEHKLLLDLHGETCIRRTIKQVKQSKFFNDNIYVLTDSSLIQKNIEDMGCHMIITSKDYRNGSERISKNLSLVNSEFKYIVNIQADEPYISPRNIDFSIEKHLKNNTDDVKKFIKGKI